MSRARIVVLALRLISLGAILFSLSVVLQLATQPQLLQAQGVGAMDFPSGCFVIVALMILMPPSILPALAGWWIQARIVRPREAAEQSLRDSASTREERLGVWTMYVIKLLLHRTESSHVSEGTVRPILRAEIPRATRELDRGRIERLFLFFRESGLEEVMAEGYFQTADGMPTIGPVTVLPSRRKVMAMVSILFMMSAFLVLWTGLGATSMLTTDFQSVLGLSFSKSELLVGAASCCLTPALMLGLAAIGLLRMYRQAVRSLRQRASGDEAIQDLALKNALDQLATISSARMDGAGIGIGLLQIARAVVLMSLPELEGPRKGRLVQSLFQKGWLTGEHKISMAGASLRGAELKGTSLPGICLAGADLSGADLNGTDLGRAELRRCVFQGSDLRFSRLTSADLQGADLRYARLQKAVLEGADLREALVEGANFWGAGMSGAELSGTRGTAEFINNAGEGI
jgi:uncharacterized protein YjbI with pentapeptide repeats